MADLPGAPPPVDYIERDRATMRGCLVRLGWIALVTAVLGVAAAVFVLAARIIAGPDSAALGGAAWLIASIVGAVYFVRWRDRRRTSESAPWERDRSWPRNGEVRSAPLPGVGARELAFVPVLAAGGWLVLWHGAGGLSGKIVACVVTTGALLWCARSWFAGGVQARWVEFPMRTGTRVCIHVATTRGASSMSEFVAFLRCVETRRLSCYVDSAAQVVASVACATPGPLAAGPDEFVIAEFDIPADAPGTDLSRPGEERYWELVVLGTTAWGKIAETSVVPIYADPAAPAARAAGEPAEA